MTLGKVERRGGGGSWRRGGGVSVGATCAGRDGVWVGTGAPGLGALFFCWMHNRCSCYDWLINSASVWRHCSVYTGLE